MDEKKLIDSFKCKSPDSRDLKDILCDWDNKKKSVAEVYEKLAPIENDGKPSSPNPLKLTLRKTGENAYQRAFFKASALNNKHTMLVLSNKKKLKIQWLDMEIPVVNKDKIKRKECLDLIGKIKNSYVIAELKDIRGTSPFDALREALLYAISTRETNSSNCALAQHKAFINDVGTVIPIKDYWKDYVRCNYLLIAAPESYWKKWNDHIDKVKEIAYRVGELVNCRVILASFPETKFIDQVSRSQLVDWRKAKPKYEPEIASQSLRWTEIFNIK